MILEGDFNEVIGYINIWNGDFQLGLAAHTPIEIKAAWTVDNLLVMLSKAAPGLLRYETEEYDLKPPTDFAKATKGILFETLKRNYRFLYANELSRIPGESDRMVLKSLRGLDGLIPIPDEAIQKANQLEDDLRQNQPELGYAEIRKRWYEEVDRNMDREAILAALPQFRRDAIEAWAAERERCSKLTAEQAVQEFYGISEIQPESVDFSPPPDDFGKTFYESYSQQVARQVIEALPVAHKALKDSGRRNWSPTFISDYAVLSPARTGQVINAFREWAKKNSLPLSVNGIPLPPDRRKGQGRKSRKTASNTVKPRKTNRKTA